MALNCDALISQAIGTSCTPHPAGYEKRAIIINKADIDTITIEDNVISEIELKSGKSGYEIKQQGKAFMGTKVEGVVGDYGNTWNKTVQFVSCEVGADVGIGLYDALLNGEFLMIFENKDKGTDEASAFEVFGLETGLKFATGTGDNSVVGAKWTFTLVEEGAMMSNVYYYATSYTATKAAFESLLTPATDTP